MQQRQGLSAVAAAEKLNEVGPNRISRQSALRPWSIWAHQFRGVMLWLLAAAAAIAFLLGENADAVAITAIIAINAIVGFFQEFRAERAIAALRDLTAPKARVIRDGQTQEIPAQDLVPGDLLVLDAGDLVGADARLLEAHRLTVNEAALTGESLPVEKRTQAVAPDAPLAERHDRVFLGTAVVDGSGLAEVTATGMQTELGRIAQLLAEVKPEPTPLQKRLDAVGRILMWLCLAVVLMVAVLGLLRGEAWLSVLMIAVSLAVAAVPEGLTAVVTIALAVGVQRMAARHVLVRKLAAVETLGCASVICTDKTGTLTTGQMTVRELWGDDHVRLLDAAAACCDATLAETGSGSGDPTELAILQAALERGIFREAIERERPRVAVNPFDSTRKRMSIWRADGVLYVKGAVDLLLPLCQGDAERALETNRDMGSRGLRVIAVAVGASQKEENLRLLGLIGMADPPRSEAIAAVRDAHAAGIRTVMITGDHPVTARAIAAELGILRNGDAAHEVVHARATPEDKIAIVRAWKERGAIVAMTGDGVNDAPALREAHIGIAMGRTGTEVAREASAMVLSDDNFASIVAAVREGRGIYDNIRKTLVYLLAGNAGELLLMFVAAAVGMPLPLAPLQILWINLVTDGLPALALVVDPTADDVLKRPPRPADEAILAKPQWLRIGLTGLLEAAVTFSMFAWALQNRDLDEARTLAFTTLVFGELFRAFAARHDRLVLWQVGAFSNKLLLAVVGVSILLQVGIQHWSLTQQLLQLSPLSLYDLALTLAAGLLPVSILELSKLLRSGRS